MFAGMQGAIVRMLWRSRVLPLSLRERSDQQHVAVRVALWCLVVNESPASAFVRLFRREALHLVEYCYGPESAAYGTMVGGTRQGFATDVERFCTLLPYAKDWSVVAARFLSRVNQAIRYFRVEVRQEEFEQLTAYVHYLEPLDRTGWSHIIDGTLATRWPGPDPFEVGRLLGTTGPAGVGFRCSLDGSRRLSLYFETKMDREVLCSTSLPALLASWAWPPEVAARVALHMQSLSSRSGADALGLECKADGTLRLKLDSANVPVDRALAFLHAQNVAIKRIEELDFLRACLRVDSLNYVGLSYDSGGFCGWKFYVAVPWGGAMRKALG